MNRLKCVLVCIGLTGALVAPSTASAAIRDFSGTVEGGGTITFGTKVKKGKTKKVLLPLQVLDVPISCDQGPATVDYQLNGDPLKVKNKAFSFTTPPSQQPPTTEIAGKFKRKGKKATGTFRDHGDFDANHTNCDTGEVDWSAKKT
jgi:hypothetical protein